MYIDRKLNIIQFTSEKLKLGLLFVYHNPDVKISPNHKNKCWMYSSQIRVVCNTMPHSAVNLAK